MALVPPTVEEFAAYTGLASDEPYLEESLTVAIDLVDDYLADAYRDVPQSVYSNEVLRTAHAVFKQNETTAGGSLQQIVELGQVTTTRYDRDPLTASKPTLRRFTLPW